MRDKQGKCFRDCNDEGFPGSEAPPTRTGAGGPDTSDDDVVLFACRGRYLHPLPATNEPTTVREAIADARQRESIARRFMRRLRSLDLPDGRSRERARLFVETVGRTFENRLIPLHVQMRDAIRERDNERLRILWDDLQASLDPDVKDHDSALGIDCWRQ